MDFKIKRRLCNHTDPKAELPKCSGKIRVNLRILFNFARECDAVVCTIFGLGQQSLAQKTKTKKQGVLYNVLDNFSVSSIQLLSKCVPFPVTSPVTPNLL
jgi:hypothetical protein